MQNGLFYFNHGVTTIQDLKNYTVASHTHNRYEIFQLVNGYATYVINGRRYDLHSGDLIIVNKNEFHDIESHNELYERRVIEFDADFLLENYSTFHNVLYPFEYDSNNNNSNKIGKIISSEYVNLSNINDIFNNIENCINDGINIDLFLHVYIMEILLEIMKIFKTAKISDDNYNINKYVERAIGFIEKNILSTITLNDLEKDLHLSRYHLCRLFKKHVGTSIISYITFKKMIYAENLIKKGFSPSQACETLCYNNYSNFFNHYKKYIKMTPAQTKAINSNKNANIL